MPYHDKPVSNYPHTVATRQCVVAWLKAKAYEGINDRQNASKFHTQCGMLIELKEARLKHEREGQR